MDLKRMASLPDSLLSRSPWQRRATQAAAALLAVDAALALVGLIVSFAHSYDLSRGQNHYTGVWISAFAIVLVAQAATVVCAPCALNGGRRPAARLGACLWYATWMGCVSIVLLIGMAAPGMASQYAWAFVWWPPVAMIAAAAVQRRRAAPGAGAADATAVRIDVHQQGGAPACCSRSAWRRCWSNYWAFVAWSSLFWLSALGFFLALQAAWLVSDARAYPPPGKLYPVRLDDGSGLALNVHLRCFGPAATTGLSTFVFEAGGGAPGVAAAAIADALAISNRRACWYDRLGYGWSDEMRSARPAGDQAAVVLRGLLAAAGEAPPYIIAGHSAGGQLALLFAGKYPDLVSGVALLDSYDDVAISLAWTGSSNETARLPSGREVVRPRLTHANAAILTACDAVRAITPFAWARLITMSHDTSFPYLGAYNAMYGGNKAWQAQWYYIKTSLTGVPDISDLLSDLAGAQFWHGTGWPSLGAKPVLLLPAADTLRSGLPAGCEPEALLASAACQAGVLASDDPRAVYPSLYLAYLATLSSNTSMVVMPGGHDFPTRAFGATASALLAKFGGV